MREGFAVIAFIVLALIFEYADAHPALLWLAPLAIVLLPLLSFVAKEAKRESAERERAERRKAEAARKKAAAEEKQRKAEEKQAAEAAAPKRGPGRPRKHPAPDPDAPKRKPGRPRKNPAPAQRPEIISNSAPRELSELEKAAFDNLFTPEEFLNHIG